MVAWVSCNHGRARTVSDPKGGADGRVAQARRPAAQTQSADRHPPARAGRALSGRSVLVGARRLHCRGKRRRPDRPNAVTPAVSVAVEAHRLTTGEERVDFHPNPSLPFAHLRSLTRIAGAAISQRWFVSLY